MMAAAKRLGFQRVTFEFENGAILECSLSAIRSVEYSSETGSGFAQLDISFVVPLTTWAHLFEPDALMPPNDLALPGA